MEQKSETKICQNCKNNFIIGSDDFLFYEKLKVPAPTWCPECRLIRRLAFVGDWFFYNDNCDKCHKKIVSIFHPETPYIVYCSSCWWGDGWDQTDYARDYDFSKSFFEQFYELRKVIPYQEKDNRNSTNCDYCDTTIRCKDCTFVFGGLQSINCSYCESAVFSRDSVDSDIIFNSDHVYETVNSNGVYKTRFVYFSDSCIDSPFLFNCIGCSNCFGCVNLRNKKYCIWNKQYTKEEYYKEIKKWNLGSYEIMQKSRKFFMELYYNTPRRFALIVNSNNVTGNDIKNTNNCKVCFATRHGVENCKYIFTCGLLLKDSYDTTAGGDTSELFYENAGSLQSQKVMFSHSCNNSRDIEYSDRIFNCQDCFGCVMFRDKKYCILNKQYGREEYFKMVDKIKKHMNEMPYVDSKGRVYKYGEFFPAEHSLWPYNETWANQWFPLTKEELLEKGFVWRDPLKRAYKITISFKDLIDDIKNVDNSILNEVILCEHSGQSCGQQCSTAFRILPNELEFYRSMELPLPRLCPTCRYYERLKMTNPPKLWNRKCLCQGLNSKNGIYKNTEKHFHGDNPCQNEFQTSISEDRKEIVYCKECYQSEFI